MTSILVESCPVCAGRHSRLFDARQFQGRQVENRLCLKCGLVFQSPRMPDAELASFYEAEYRRLYQGSAGPNSKDLAIQQARAAALYDFILPKVKQAARHLDIGCSAGLLLARLRDGLGCAPTGVEPGNAYREYAQGQGLPVYASLEELKAQGEERYDLVSMAHVLEHLPDPVAYLIELREQWLAPGGRLLLETPNLYAHDSFEVAHLVSYSPHTLGQTLAKAGYEVLALEAHGRPRSVLLPLYLTVLARPLEGAFPYQPRPERGVRFKRQWGMLRGRILSRLFPRHTWLPLPKQPLPDRKV